MSESISKDLTKGGVMPSIEPADPFGAEVAGWRRACRINASNEWEKQLPNDDLLAAHEPVPRQATQEQHVQLIESFIYLGPESHINKSSPVSLQPLDRHFEAAANGYRQGIVQKPRTKALQGEMLAHTRRQGRWIVPGRGTGSAAARPSSRAIGSSADRADQAWPRLA